MSLSDAFQKLLPQELPRPAWWWIPAAAVGSLATYAAFFEPTPAKCGWSGPTPYPLLGSLPRLLKHKHRLHDWRLENTRKYMEDGVWGSCGMMGRKILHLCDAKSIEHVLSTNFGNYRKSPEFLGLFEELLGDGIFNVNGEKWRWQRKAASHMFSLSTLRDTMLPEMVGCSKKLVDRVAEKADSGEAFDLQDLFFRATMDAICLIAFGKDVGALDKNSEVPFTAAWDAASHYIIHRATNPLWKLYRFVQSKDEREFSENIKVINDFAYSVVRSRQKLLKEDPAALNADILSLFIKRAHKNGETLSERFLRDVVLSMVIAGRDTTACLLSWMSLELMQNPDVEKEMLTEINSLFSVDEEPYYDGLKQMEYTEAVSFEALRLHPSVPFDVKMAINDDVLPGGQKVYAGCEMLYAPYTLGRLATLWKEPLVFKPSRWLGSDREESTSSINQYKYAHFNAGPRLCLGKHVAVLEVKLFMASLFRKFRFELVNPNEKVDYEVGVTLSIKGSLTVRAFKR